MRIQHQQIQPVFPFDFMKGGKQHSVRDKSHHGPRRKVRDSYQRLSDHLFRFIIGMDTGQDHAVRACSVIQCKFQQLFGFRHSLTVKDLDYPEITLGERILYKYLTVFT